MAEVITHADVVDAYIEEHYADNVKAGQEFRSNCKRWCSALGSSLQAPAEETLGDAFEAKQVRYQQHLASTYPGRPTAGKNVRTAVSKLRAAYIAMLASQDLPTDFTKAFQQAMDAKGMTPNALYKLLYEKYYKAENPKWYPAQLWSFYSGEGAPGSSRRGDSRLLLQRTEEILQLAPGTLVSRGYRTPTPILLGSATPIPYRDARNRQREFRFAMRALPLRISRIFEAFAQWRTQSYQKVDGEHMSVQARSIWNSPQTREMCRQHFCRYFGWLCLPAPSKPTSELTDEERWSTGKGMHPKDLRMSHLFDTDLALEYVEFLRGRQHNHVYTKTHSHFLHSINAFVSKPYSFLPNHPEHAVEFGLAEPTSMPEWREVVEALHQRVKKACIVVDKQLGEKQRSPDEPLRHVIAHEDPFGLFALMVDRFEADEPHKANKFRWAKWARDVALFRMQLDVPLRARNLVELELRHHLNRDAVSGRWAIFIPLAELKNHYSGAAQDIDRLYSPETSQAMDRYVNDGRKHLVGAESSAFFLGPAAGRRANPKFAKAAGYKISTYALDNAIRNALVTYFGQGQGITIFRHITATGILKDDPTQVDLAAAELNDSPNTIRDNYSHLVQRDKLRLSDRWREAKKQKRNGRPPQR